MEVNRISSPGVEARSIDQPTRPRAVREGEDDAVFNQTASLNKALSDSPDVRGDEVARAKGLLSSLKYPPDEIVAGIARLITGQKRESQ